MTLGHGVLTAFCYQTVRTRSLMPALVGVLPVLVLGVVNVVQGAMLVRRGRRGV